MRSPIESSHGKYQFKSTSLRRWRSIVESSHGKYQSKSQLLRSGSQLLNTFTNIITNDMTESRVSYLLDGVSFRLMGIDRLMKRLEKTGKLRELLPGISQEVIDWIDYLDTFIYEVDSGYSHLDWLLEHHTIQLESWIAFFRDSVSSELEFAHNVVVSAVVLLSFVYQYLIGYVDRGGSKTYSSGSLEFRATYVSIVLFQGSYVWIKFRDVAPKRSVYRRSRKDEFGRVIEYYGKYEPRFKPPREKKDLGTSLKFNYLPLGGYDTQPDAEVVHQIAAFYYDKDEGRVKLEDGSYFSIPLMSEQERGLSGKKKANWVSAKVKKVYEEFKKEKAARSSLPRSNTLSEYSADELAEFPCDAFVEPAGDQLMVSLDPENLFDVDDVLNAFKEEFGGPPTLSSETDDVAQHDFQWPELPQNPNIVNCQEGSDALALIPDTVASGSNFNTKQENLIQQLINLQKEQLEDEFNRQISEQHQQHLQNQQRLEERILELQRENEHLKSTLHQVVKPLRSHFATSTEI